MQGLLRRSGRNTGETTHQGDCWTLTQTHQGSGVFRRRSGFESRVGPWRADPPRGYSRGCASCVVPLSHSVEGWLEVLQTRDWFGSAQNEPCVFPSRHFNSIGEFQVLAVCRRCARRQCHAVQPPVRVEVVLEVYWKFVSPLGSKCSRNAFHYVLPRVNPNSL